MREHSWVVDATRNDYLCSECGCSGGVALHGNGRTRPPEPFLGGASIDVSDDCDIAHEQISFYMRGFLRAYLGTDPLCHVIFVADRVTPQDAPRGAMFLQLTKIRLGEVDDVDSLRAALVGSGYKVDYPSCTSCGKPTGRPAGERPEERCYSCQLALDGI